MLATGALAAPAAARYAYVVTSADNSVARIDLRTNPETLDDSIESGDHPVAVAITPDGTTAYVVNSEGQTVTPIDLTTTPETAGDAIAVGDFPRGIAITPDGATAFVANWDDDAVTPIDLTTTPETPGDAIDVGDRPIAIAITPDATTAYVVNSGDDSVTPIDTATKSVDAEILVGNNPRAIAITPDGTTAYVVNAFSNSVTPIDLTATPATAGATIGVGSQPNSIAITPDGASAYVADFNGDTVTPIDLTTTPATSGDPIAVGDGPFGIAITPNGATAYVANSFDDTVTPIDTATNTARAAIAVVGAPEAIAITPNQPPEAELAVPATGYTGGPVAFDATASSDDEGTENLSFRFDFGDGSSAASTDGTRSHTYTAPGTYEVSVTVDDGEGCEPLTDFFPALASPFTGQTAHCNGPSKVTSEIHEIQVSDPPVYHLRVSAERPQSPNRIELDATCDGADCSVRARGRIVVRGNGKRKTFPIAPQSADLTDGAAQTLALKPPKRARRAARKALRFGGAARARIRVASDAGPSGKQVRVRGVRLAR